MIVRVREIRIDKTDSAIVGYSQPVKICPVVPGASTVQAVLHAAPLRTEIASSFFRVRKYG